MLYKQLTDHNTRVWIKNFEKVIKLNELLIEKSKDRHVFMLNEYTEKYRSGFWGKLFYNEKCCLYGGKIYEKHTSWSVLKKMTPYTEGELDLEEHTDTYFYFKKDDLIKTFERWSKYADRPFQIEEKDVIYYQDLVTFQNETIEIAKGIGLDYEAFNLDEYRQNSS
jgi:hypothetical protein